MSTKKEPKPTPDCRKMYQLAEHYSEASLLLEQQVQGEGWGCPGPKLLVDSFAVELYLKCLYVQDKGETPPREHDLMKLFEALNSSTRDLIRKEFDRSVRDHPVLSNLHLINPEAVKTTDFERALKAASNTVEGRRYLYEEQKVPCEWFYAHILGDAIRCITKLDFRIMTMS